LDSFPRSICVCKVEEDVPRQCGPEGAVERIVIAFYKVW